MQLEVFVASVCVCVLGVGGAKVFFSSSERDHPHRATVSIDSQTGFFRVFFAIFMVTRYILTYTNILLILICM